MQPRLTYANVVATLALFLALTTGGAWAASKLINGKRIKPGTVRTKQLGKNAVTAAKVKDGSLTAGDFGAGQLPQGPKGDPGPAGNPGANGKDGAAGPTGPVGPSGLVKTYSADNFQVNPVADGDYHQIESFAVPAGSYLVNATLDLANNDSSDPTDIACSIVGGGSVFNGDGDIPARAGYATYRYQTIAITGAVTLATAGDIRLGCVMTEASGLTFGPASFNATQVSSVVGPG